MSLSGNCNYEIAKLKAKVQKFREMQPSLTVQQNVQNQQQLCNLQCKITELEDEIHGLMTTLTVQENQNRDLQSRLTLQENDRRKLQSGLIERKASLRVQLSENEELLSKVTDQKIQMWDLQSRLTLQENDRRKLQSGLVKLQDQSKELESSLRVQLSENEELQSRLTQQQNQIVALESKLKAQENENQESQCKVTEQQNDNHELQSTLILLHDQITDFESKLLVQENKYNGLQSRLTSQLNVNTELQSKVDFLRMSFGNHNAGGILQPDVAILVQDRKDAVLHAHKLVLARKSHVFNKMLNSPTLLESEEGFIRIQDASLPVMQAVVEFCYNAEISFTNEVTFEAVLEVAHKYGIHLLEKTCEEQLLLSIVDVNLPRMLKLARKLDSDRLKAGALEYFKANFDAVLDELFPN